MCRLPVDKYTHLGYDYLSPIGGGRYHSGVDLNRGRGNEDKGDPVYAMEDGEVVFARNTTSGWGGMIVIKHPDHKVWSRYGHLSSMLVSPGDKVKEGQKIGEVGNTGHSTYAHLHFDVILEELPSWEKYTTNMSKEDIRKVYADPLLWIKNYKESKCHAPISEYLENIIALQKEIWELGDDKIKKLAHETANNAREIREMLG